MNGDEEKLLHGSLLDSAIALQQYAQDRAQIEVLATFAENIVRAFTNGKKLMIVGNGGSAGDAQHIACEFVTRLRFERAPLPVIALSADSSVITAIGNDYGFEYIFERQVQAIGNAGDVLLGLSTSGNSLNVLRALSAAKQKNIITLGFTGLVSSAMERVCDVLLRAPAPRNFIVQQIHITAAHAICSLVENRLFEVDQSPEI